MSTPASDAQRQSGSFRDPSGRLFSHGGVLFRQVNKVYEPHFQKLHSSGLYDDLAARKLLVPHTRVEPPLAPAADHAATIVPARIPFISYPYEWSFSQLKDAALLTLTIAETALAHDMILKDASAYNVQFIGAQPIFIDTLSFESYREGAPWAAYKQFCQHFLAPLALMARRDIRLGQLLRLYMDGVPLDLAATLLPFASRLSPGLLMHLHLHARFQRTRGAASAASRSAQVTRKGLRAILDSLRGVLQGLTWSPAATTWSDYYSATNYSAEALAAKERITAEFVSVVNPKTAWDLGANTGVFSACAARGGAYVVSADFDASAVEQNYRRLRAEQSRVILPLVVDLANPPPAQGWAHRERDSLLQRGPADLVLALALVHHLAIGNNVPLPETAAFFAACGASLILEFVPKSDSQVQRMLAAREDIFTGYDRENLERAFAHYFTIERSELIPDTQRILYLMRRRSLPTARA